MANTKVQSEQIANNAVVTATITDANITTAKIAADAITTAKIADSVGLGGSPTTTTQSASDNTTKVATTAYVTTALANLADSAPTTLDTLNELAAALGDDANFSTTVTNSIATKLPLAGGAMTGAITTNSTFDGVDIATRDAILTSTTTTAGAALPKAGGTLTGTVTSSSHLQIAGNLDIVGQIGAYNNPSSSWGSMNFRATDYVFKNSGGTSKMTLSSTGNLDLAGTLDVTGATVLDSTLGVAGTTKLGEIASIGQNSPVSPNDATSFLHIGDANNQDTSIVLQDAVEIWEIYQNDNLSFRFDTTAVMTLERVTGNVGIGTDTPLGKFVVSNGGAEGIEVFPGSASGQNSFQHYNRSGSAYLRNRNIASEFTFNLSGAADDAVTFKAGGNVGIGTNAPGWQLDVRRNDTGNTPSIGIRQLGSGDASMDFQTTTSPYGFSIGVDGSDSDKFKIASAPGDVGTNTRFTIDTSGNVGIGTTSPAAKLDIATAGSTAKPLAIRITNAASTTYAWEIWRDNTDGDLRFGEELNGTDTTRVTFESGGKVGIGTTAPAVKIHASQTYATPTNGISADTVGIFSKNDTANGNANISVLSRSSGTASLYLGDESDENKWAVSSLTSNSGLTFNYAGAERFRIAGAGHFTFTGKDANSNQIIMKDSGGATDGTLYAEAGEIGFLDADGNWAIKNTTDTDIRFSVNNSEKMRILADGEIVCQNSIFDTYAPLVNGVTADAFVMNRHSTAGSLGMWRTNTMEWKVYHNGVGYIMTWGSNGVISGDFNDTSDLNLKENISSITDGTTVIKALRPVKFDWKASKKGNNQHGFIAQEVEAVLPDAIEGNDYVENETGLPEDEPAGNGKNMNSNAVLAHAVKAIQELEARIATLEE